MTQHADKPGPEPCGAPVPAPAAEAAPLPGVLGALGARFRALPAARRGISALVTGTAVGQVVGVLTSPVLTRLYGPADLGALAVYAALVSMLAVVVCGRYELAINVCASETEAANVLALSLLSALLLSALSVGAVLLGAEAVATAAGAPELAWALWLLPLSLVGVGTYNALACWAIRGSGYGRLARTRATQGLSLTAVQLGLGAVGLVPAGLFLGDAVSRSSGVGTLARATWREDRKALRQVSWQGMMQAAHRYRRFPLYGSGSALMNTLALEVPVFFLALHYSTRVTGDYALVQRLLAVPLVMLGRAVATYYVGEGTRRLRTSPRTLRPLFRRTVLQLALYGGLPLCLGGLLCPWLVPLVFGSAWHEAGRYALVVSVLAAVQLVAVPVSGTLNFLERQGLQLAWDAGRLALVLGSLGLAFALGASPMVAIITFAAAMSLAYLALLAMAARAVRAATAQHLLAGATGEREEA
ncbi:MAG TPA: oligosaccharide flippase family protein [Aggregicoccus sp.]|nr:oligosaccharide flippase family protein [Aggregicoccus sp.]